MQRVFKVTLPADTNFHNLYTSLLGVTGAVPTDGILADRCCSLTLTADSGNAGTVVLGDSNFANTFGPAIAANGTIYDKQTQTNAICLRDFNLKGSAASQAFEAVITYR